MARFFSSSRSSTFLNSDTSLRPPGSPRSSTHQPLLSTMSISPARDEHFAGRGSNLSFKPMSDVSCHGFPSMIPPRPDKPLDAMDQYALRDKYGAPQLITDFTPPDAVMELTLFFCRSTDPTSNQPNIRVHNLRAAHMLDGTVTHLIFDAKVCRDIEDLKTKADECIKKDLLNNGISSNDLKKIWWHDGATPAEEFWSNGLIKHARFAADDSVEDIYASMTYKLADPILNGRGSNPSLAEFLGKKFDVGKYHEVEDLKVALKDFFGVDVYPRFIGQGKHPSLFEIGILYTKDGSRRIDHPLAHKVPSGKFLMRKI